MSQAHDTWMDRQAALQRAARLRGRPVVCIKCERLIRPTVCPRCGAFNASAPASTLELGLLIIFDAHRQNTL